MTNKNIAIVFLLVLAMVAGGLFVYEKQKNSQIIMGLKNDLSNCQKEDKPINKNNDDPKNPVEKIELNEDDYDTSDWLTYRNEKFGYEVKHPKDGYYEVITSNLDSEEDSGNIVDFILDKELKQSGNRFTYIDDMRLTAPTPLKEGNKKATKEEIKKYFMKDFNKGNGVQLTINGNEAYKYYDYLNDEYKGQEDKTIRTNGIVKIFGNGSVYEIEVGDQDYMFTKEKEVEYFDKFLSTFKLIDIKK